MTRKTPMKRSSMKRTQIVRKPSTGVKKKPKTQTQKKSTVINKNDALARALCHARGRCEACDWVMHDSKGQVMPCQGIETLQWCHIDSRKSHKTRWDSKNCVCMCARHHAYFTSKPVAFGAFIESLYPGRTQYLIEKSMEQFKSDMHYLLSENDRLKQEMSAMKLDFMDLDSIEF